MGMSSYILDLEDKFIDKASEIIGECEVFADFQHKMAPHYNMLIEPANVVDDMLSELWEEYWSKYI